MSDARVSTRVRGMERIHLATWRDRWPGGHVQDQRFLPMGWRPRSIGGIQLWPRCNGSPYAHLRTTRRQRDVTCRMCLMLAEKDRYAKKFEGGYRP